MFSSIRGSIRYSGACSALGSGDIPLALSEIEETKRLLGNRIDKPSVYYVNIKAAEIYLRAKDIESAKYHLEKSIEQILSYKILSPKDRNYLLDYCDLFRNDISEIDEGVTFRVSPAEYGLVKKSIRREFPIKW